MSAAGGIVDLSGGAAPEPLTVDVLVVGSGCGGATAARVLAEAGREVLVLEEGGDLTGPQLTQRDGAMYDQLYMDRGGRLTHDLSVSVLQGRVLGGGAVINMCDVVPMKDEVLRCWQARFGLADFAPDAFAPYQAQALIDLSASRPADVQVNLANRLLERGAQALGWRGEIMLHNRVGCIGAGTCVLGCSFNAKRNPRFVAIPAAIAAGARFWTRARAVRIEDASAELKTVRVRPLDAKGYREQGETTVRARTVIVAASAVNTAQLLLRSAIGNEHTGRHLSLQPQLAVAALFEQPIRAFRGIPQSFALTEFETASEEEGLGGFRVEPVMVTPGNAASIVPTGGAAGKQFMTMYPNLAASLCLVPDVTRGTVELRPSGRPLVRYELSADVVRRFQEAAKAAARCYLAAGAKAVIVPMTPLVVLEGEADLARLDSLRFPPASAAIISAHQQGSVRMAPSARDGAADPDGQVYGTRGVYVFDSSGFPTSASSHTMTPIIAASRMLTAKLLARGA